MIRSSENSNYFCVTNFQYYSIVEDLKNQLYFFNGNGVYFQLLCIVGVTKGKCLLGCRLGSFCLRPFGPLSGIGIGTYLSRDPLVLCRFRFILRDNVESLSGFRKSL